MWVGMWATSLDRHCVFFTMVSNGDDTMRFPSRALNVKVEELETSADKRCE